MINVWLTREIQNLFLEYNIKLEIPSFLAEKIVSAE